MSLTDNLDSIYYFLLLKSDFSSVILALNTTEEQVYQQASTVYKLNLSLLLIIQISYCHYTHQSISS